MKRSSLSSSVPARQCGLCQTAYDLQAYLPMIVPCDNSCAICKVCLNELTTSKKMVCLMCKGTLARSAVASDLNPLVLMDLAKQASTFTVKSEVPVIRPDGLVEACDVCLPDNLFSPANTYCFDCEKDQWMCDYHHKKHSNEHDTHCRVHSCDDIFEDADLMEFVYANPRPPIGRCSKHVNSPMLMFCIDCSELTCPKCSAVEHQGHNLRDNQAVLKAQRHQLEAHVKLLDERHQRQMECKIQIRNVLDKLDHNKEQVMQVELEIAAALQRQLYRITERMDSRCPDLRTACDSLSNPQSTHQQQEGVLRNQARSLQGFLQSHDISSSSKLLAQAEITLKHSPEIDLSNFKLPNVSELQIGQLMEDIEQIFHERFELLDNQIDGMIPTASPKFDDIDDESKGEESTVSSPDNSDDELLQASSGDSVLQSQLSSSTDDVLQLSPAQPSSSTGDVLQLSPASSEGTVVKSQSVSSEDGVLERALDSWIQASSQKMSQPRRLAHVRQLRDLTFDHSDYLHHVHRDEWVKVFAFLGDQLKKPKSELFQVTCELIVKWLAHCDSALLELIPINTINDWCVDALTALSTEKTHPNYQWVELILRSFSSPNRVFTLLSSLETPSSLLSDIQVLRIAVKAVDVKHIAPHLGSLTQLRHLDLSRSSLTRKVCDTLGPCLASAAHLEALTLAKCSMRLEALTALCPGLSGRNQLLRLDVSQNHLGDIGWSHLVATIPPSLTHLDLTMNGISEKGCGELSKVMSRLPLLQELTLSGNPVAEAGQKLVDAYCRQAESSVRLLDISDTGIDSRSLKAYSQTLLLTPALTHLKMSFDESGGCTGATMLCQALCTLSSLRCLDLSKSSISPVQCDKLCQSFEHLKQLNDLQLQDNLIGVCLTGTHQEKGAFSLVNSLPHLISLRHFDVTDNDLTSEVCNLIVDAVGGMNTTHRIHVKICRGHSMDANTFASYPSLVVS